MNDFNVIEKIAKARQLAKEKLIREACITLEDKQHTDYVNSCPIAYQANSSMAPGHFGGWLIVGEFWEGFHKDGKLNY